MMNISDIRINKRFVATFKGINAVVDYRIDEDWFSVVYFDGDTLLLKEVRNTISEQYIFQVIRYTINNKINKYDKNHIK